MIAIMVTQTRQTRVLKAISILAGGALLLVLLLHFREASAPVKTLPTVPEGYDSLLIVNGTEISVTVADTEAKQEQGLSGTPSLADNTGKLFIFKDAGTYGFWMKDMQYSLDIIWIDEAMTIVGIEHDVRPETYPTVFYPPRAVSYVLEVNAGFSTQHNLTEGQKITVIQKSN